VTSLREKHRERRRNDIMDAAWALVGDKGLEGTSIEEIATKAEVGTATVYNYFGSKNDLLQALFVRYIEQEVEAGETAVRNPPNDMAEGMAALFETYLVRAAANCSPTLMREFYVLSMSKQFGYGRETYRLKQGFMAQAVALATHYKERGWLRSDVTPADAAVLCYSAVTFPFLLMFLGMGVDLEQARQQVRRYVRLTIDGIGAAVKAPQMAKT
jgi:AcrR family transcriptional regulator